MAKFDASSIDTIDFDFTKWRPAPVDGEPAEGTWSGTVPEPSQEQILAFFEASQDIMLERAEFEERSLETFKAEKRAQWAEKHPDAPVPSDDVLFEDETVGHIRARIAAEAKARTESRKNAARRVNQAIADLTSDTPGVVVLEALPFRVVDGFTGWLAGFFRPEALAADTPG